MEAAHGTHTPPGYPLAMAQQLVADGGALEVGFGIFGWYEALPRTADELTRHLKLTGAPDLVVVQLGAIYGLRRVVSDNNRLDGLRGAVARALGPLAIHVSRLTRPVGQRLGTPARAYPGTAALESFLELAQRTWPALLACSERTTGANGYNLNATGSRIVADELLALVNEVPLAVL